MNTKIAIMQPTYLPWLGYFALIDKVDKFVIYDNVQFVFRSWQRSNKIKSRDGEKKISLGVNKRQFSRALIKDVALNPDSNWRDEHLNLFREYYQKAPFYEEVLDLYRHSIEGHVLLSDLNFSLIQNICTYLGVCDPSRFIKASTIEVSGKRSELLINIIQNLDGNYYLSPTGSYDYIEEEGYFFDTDIDLFYLNYEHPDYSQLHGDFVSHLSIIDLLFNHGKKSMDIIRSGYRDDMSHDALKKIKSDD